MAALRSLSCVPWHRTIFLELSLSVGTVETNLELWPGMAWNRPPAELTAGGRSGAAAGRRSG